MNKVRKGTQGYVVHGGGRSQCSPYVSKEEVTQVRNEGTWLCYRHGSSTSADRFFTDLEAAAVLYQQELTTYLAWLEEERSKVNAALCDLATDGTLSIRGSW